MRVETLCFGLAYQRYLKVLEYSMKKYSPNTPFTANHFDNIDKQIQQQTRKMHHVYKENTFKTKVFFEIVEQANDGELLCLMDCDMFVLGDLSVIQQQEFDFAYTVRPSQRYPFNTGVVFVRVSSKTKVWFQRWYKYVQKFAEDAALFSRQRQKYGRINQCGLGMLLERPHDLLILPLECAIWNACPQTLTQFSPETTKIVHILGELRERILNGRHSSNSKVLQAANIWRELENEASNSNVLF